MTDFDFTYMLTGPGWARATVEDRQNAPAMEVSYLSNALGDLVNAIISLFSETSGDPIICEWHDEPGENIWTFRRNDAYVRIHILQSGVYPRGLPIEDFDDDNCDKLLFDDDCSLLHLATQVEDQMRHVLQEYGEAGYKEKWMEDDFPMKELTHLTDLIRGYRREHPAERE
ncbi:MAG: hypothetical protein P4L33_18135 [Capsulimonadaceae bacterium]|nr:hypothetical protein [Capsulimonadaceae bacterium]